MSDKEENPVGVKSNRNFCSVHSESKKRFQVLYLYTRGNADKLEALNK